jgi:hypothetical protein
MKEYIDKDGVHFIINSENNFVKWIIHNSKTLINSEQSILEFEDPLGDSSSGYFIKDNLKVEVYYIFWFGTEVIFKELNTEKVNKVRDWAYKYYETLQDIL